MAMLELPANRMPEATAVAETATAADGRESLREAIQAHGIFICPPGDTMPARDTTARWTNLFMLRRVTQDGVLLQLCCDQLAWLMRADGLNPWELQFAGIETGAIPLVSGLALMFGCPSFIVRRERRNHGVFNRIEGRVHPTRTTVLVDDIFAGGTRTRQCVEAICGSRYTLNLETRVYALVQNGDLDCVNVLGRDWRARSVFRRREFNFQYRQGSQWTLPDRRGGI